MRRLEFTHKMRTVSARAKSAAEAVIFLGQVARERGRLEQERHGLQRRIRKIDARLGVLAGTETKLVPLAQLGFQRTALPGSAVESGGEVTLRY